MPGAYGSAMASNYNRRPLPPEVLVDDGRWRVIRRRQTVDDMLAEAAESRDALSEPSLLIAFEGLDQSGKQTQAELLRDRLREAGRKARLVSFPDYGTSIGEEIARALQGSATTARRDAAAVRRQSLRAEARPAALARRRADPGLRSLPRVEHRLRRGRGCYGRNGHCRMSAGSIIWRR